MSDDEQTVAVLEALGKAFSSPILSDQKTALLCYGIKMREGFEYDDLIYLAEQMGIAGLDYKAALSQMVEDGYFEKTDVLSGKDGWRLTQKGLDEYESERKIIFFIETVKPPSYMAESFERSKKFVERFRNAQTKLQMLD